MSRRPDICERAGCGRHVRSGKRCWPSSQQAGKLVRPRRWWQVSYQPSPKEQTNQRSGLWQAQRTTVSPDVRAISAGFPLLLRDWRALGGHSGVQRDVVPPGIGYVLIQEYCVDRAAGHAGLAVDALRGIDVEHLLALHEAPIWDRADLNAIGVLALIAWFTNHVWHGVGPRRKEELALVR